MCSKKIIILVLNIAGLQLGECTKKLTEEFSWKKISFEFNSPQDRQKAQEGETYIPGNAIITSIAKYGGKMFLATPRLKSGVPSTLNVISTQDVNTKSPPLKPYPNLEMNSYQNRTSKKKKMVSVVSVKIDSCNRLWALDTGMVEGLESKKIESPPALFIFQLSDNNLLRKYTLKDEDYDQQKSNFKNIVIDDTAGSCEKASAYLADSTGSLVVYHWDTNKSYRIVNNYFSFDPLWGNLKTSDGTLHQVSEGIQAMALTQPRMDGYRDMMFHPLIGVKEFSVSTKILQNKTMAMKNISHFHFIGDRGVDMQSSASVLDARTGVLFYTAIVKNAIACWNSFRGEDIMASNQGIVEIFDEILAYPSDISIDSNGTIWVLTNRLLDFTFGTSKNDVPYRIFSGKVDQLIRNTPCKEL